MMQSKTHPKVVIVILNFNGFEDTAACLQSLRDVDYPHFSTIVVDNASSDESASLLSEGFPEIELIRANENLGFSGGSNVGIRAALSNGASYVLLLNNDTTVKQDFLKKAIEFAEYRENVGIIGGKIYYYNEPDRIWSAGGTISRFRGRGIHYGHNETDRGQFAVPRQVEFVSGALMLIRSTVFEKAGYLPEEYFFGTEEWDYCLNVSQYNFEIWYVPSVVIWHKVGQSHKQFEPMYIYNFYRNKLLFQQRILKPKVWGIWFLFFRIYFRFISPINLLLQMEIQKEDGNLKSCFEAIKSAIDDHAIKSSVSVADLNKFRER